MATLNAMESVPQWVFGMLDRLLEVKVNLLVSNGARLPPMNWIHYENAPYVPSNFVTFGDAVMKVNPTFGQGCTKACVGAIVLDSLLRSSRYAKPRNSTRLQSQVL